MAALEANSRTVARPYDHGMAVVFVPIGRNVGQRWCGRREVDVAIANFVPRLEAVFQRRI